ncbi:19302_t:CDS:2, partial [Gigaspora rosea]
LKEFLEVMKPRSKSKTWDNDDSENELDQMKSMTSHNETDVNKSGKPTEVPPEESIGETGRFFVRNLPYICSEEDLRQIFNKFGPLAEVHIPLDKETKNQKGFVYVLYHIPEHAVKAYIELDNKFFMGRLLHILPSKDKLQIRDLDPSRWSLKKKREMKQKSLASNDFNWSMLYMNSDNMAAKLTLAETHVIQETKSFLEMNGISLNSFGKKEKSDTVILVKNIPFGVTKDELLQLFGWYGEIWRVSVPLYLEKAPQGVFKSEVDPNSNQTNDDAKKIVEYDNMKNANNALKSMQ